MISQQYAYVYASEVSLSFILIKETIVEKSRSLKDTRQWDSAHAKRLTIVPNEDLIQMSQKAILLRCYATNNRRSNALQLPLMT